MIHNTAIIDPKAKLHKNVKVGPYSIIGANVEIEENTEIQSHVSILGNTKIGKNNKIYPFVSIGNDPQDLKFQGEETELEIGNDNKIREYVTINPGTNGGGGITKIGNNCLFMISSSRNFHALISGFRNLILFKQSDIILSGVICLSSSNASKCVADNSFNLYLNSAIILITFFLWECLTRYKDYIHSNSMRLL